MSDESEEIEKIIFKGDDGYDDESASGDEGNEGGEGGDAGNEGEGDGDGSEGSEKGEGSEGKEGEGTEGSDGSKDGDGKKGDDSGKEGAEGKEGESSAEGASGKDNKGGDNGEANSGSEDTPEVQTEKFNSRLSEGLGEGFKSIDDVKSHISDLEAKAKPVEFQNDILEKFTEFSQGRNMNPLEGALLFLETQTQDFKEMDPMDVLRHELEMNHSALSDEDIASLIQDKYKLDEDGDYTEKEVNLAKIQMSLDADKARKELMDIQEKIALKPAPQDAAPEEMSDEDKAKQADDNNKRQKEADESMKDFKSLSLPINKDGESFTFGVDDTSSVKSVVNDPTSFFSRYDIKDKDGKVIGADLNEFRDDMAIIQNKKAIFETLTSNGVSKGKEEMLDERRKPKDVDNVGLDSSSEKSEAEQLGAVMKAAAG